MQPNKSKFQKKV